MTSSPVNSFGHKLQNYEQKIIKKKKAKKKQQYVQNPKDIKFDRLKQPANIYIWEAGSCKLLPVLFKKKKEKKRLKPLIDLLNS